MSPEERDVREQMCFWGRSLFQRGLTPGSSGNLSARIEEGFIVTPTNSCLGFLEPTRLVKLDQSGELISGDSPTKEMPLHLAFYRGRPSARGIVHLHSTYATVLSCLVDVDPHDAIPALTPYVAMRVGKVPLVPYGSPGSTEIAFRLEETARNHAAVLLANHGPVVAGRNFEAAVYAAEELEETAKLVLLTRGQAVRVLTDEQICDLDRRYQLSDWR